MDFSQIKQRSIIITRFLSLKRIGNLLLNLGERRLERTKLLNWPRSVNLELLNFCNLKCPACPTHTSSSKRKKFYMKFSEFVTVVEKTKMFAFNFDIGGNGEVTLIPKIEDYVACAVKNRLFVSTETNLNCSREVVKRLFDAGIGRVNISLDGISQKNYGEYRLGGNFKVVYKNMLYLISLKKHAHSFFPIIQWQYIVNKYNEDEVERAKKMAKELKVDGFRDSLPFVPGGDHYFFEDNPEKVKKIAEEFLPSDSRYKIKDRVKLLGCYQPFSELQILCQGEIIPCCRLREKNIVMGNIFKQSLREIWNSPEMVYFRKQLLGQGKSPHCTICHQNMRNYLKA